MTAQWENHYNANKSKILDRNKKAYEVSHMKQKQCCLTWSRLHRQGSMYMVHFSFIRRRLWES
jgi:hypothetical protein